MLPGRYEIESGVPVTANERRVRAECPKATIVECTSTRDGGRLFVIRYDGVEYAGSGRTVAKAWSDAVANLGLTATPQGMR